MEISEKKNQLYDVIILGGGPGGYTSALYCARAGLHTLLLEKVAPGGQMGTTDQVDNYPGFPEGTNGFELALAMQQQAERFGAETRFAEVKKVMLLDKIKQVVTADNQILQAKTVVLATGASPKELGLPKERELRGKGVSYCATCDGAFFRNKKVAVIGGGDTAAADAVFLSKICSEVTLIHRRDTLRASAAYQKPLRESGKVKFLWDSVVQEILGETHVTGLRVKNKKTGEESKIICDGVFVAVGNLPNTNIFSDVALTKSGYVQAGENTKTNIAGVFAVGDVREKPLRQIVTAASDGAVSAYMIEEYLAQEFSEIKNII